MAYLGTVELKESDIRRIDITSSTSATHTLTWTAPSEQSLIVTINGVKQQNNYTVSGTTLTLDAALSSSDLLEVIGINDVGTTVTPAQGSVDTDQLANVAVTAAKLAADSVTSAKIVDGTIVNADVNASAAIDISKISGYASGTWTPDCVNNGSTSTWSTQTGYYERIGNVVFAWGFCDGGNSGSSGTALQITGLPLAMSSDLSPMCVGNVILNMSGTHRPPFGLQFNSTTVIDVYKDSADVTGSPTYISFNIIYKV